jgi:hypothetical protein
MKIRMLAALICIAFELIATLFGGLLLVLALRSESVSIVIDGVPIEDGIGLLRTIGTAMVFLSLQLLFEHADSLRGRRP